MSKFVAHKTQGERIGAAIVQGEGIGAMAALGKGIRATIATGTLATLDEGIGAAKALGEGIGAGILLDEGVNRLPPACIIAVLWGQLLMIKTTYPVTYLRRTLPVEGRDPEVQSRCRRSLQFPFQPPGKRHRGLRLRRRLRQKSH